MTQQDNNSSNKGKFERVMSSFSSFEEAEKHDLEYYSSLSGEQRIRMGLEIMAPFYATNPRFERIYRTAEPGEGPVHDSWRLGVQLSRSTKSNR